MTRAPSTRSCSWTRWKRARSSGERVCVLAFDGSSDLALCALCESNRSGILCAPTWDAWLLTATPEVPIGRAWRSSCGDVLCARSVERRSAVPCAIHVRVPALLMSAPT
jgi:hypothetical protein